MQDPTARGDFATALVTRRRRLGLRQRDLAELAGVSERFVHAMEHGKVTVKKPSRMHWTYTSPETKQFVSDGVKIYSYIP